MPRPRRQVKKRKVNKKRNGQKRKVLLPMDRIMPAALFTRLSVLDVSNTSLGSAGSTTAASQYTINSMLDYTSTVGNPDIPGYVFLSTIYRQYRVHRVKIEFECCNVSNNVIYMQLNQLDLGNVNFSTWSNRRQFSANRWSKVAMLSPLASDDNRRKLTTTFDIGSMVGSKKEWQANEDYCGFTTAGGTSAVAPLRSVVCQCQILSSDGITLLGATAGIINVKLTYDVEFFVKYALPS